MVGGGSCRKREQSTTRCSLHTAVAEAGGEGENMKEEEKFAVAEAMTRHGGSFVKALGQALMLADSDNAEKIKTAFREYWEKYWEIYKKVKENE